MDNHKIATLLGKSDADPKDPVRFVCSLSTAVSVEEELTKGYESTINELVSDMIGGWSDAHTKRWENILATPAPEQEKIKS